MLVHGELHQILLKDRVMGVVCVNSQLFKEKSSRFPMTADSFIVFIKLGILSVVIVLLVPVDVGLEMLHLL